MDFPGFIPKTKYTLFNLQEHIFLLQGQEVSQNRLAG
jgi:hypothetical protein